MTKATERAGSKSNPICVDDFMEEEIERSNNSRPVCVDDFLEDDIESSDHFSTEGKSPSPPMVDDEVSDIEGSERSDYVGLECDGSIAKDSIETDSETVSALTDYVDHESVMEEASNSNRLEPLSKTSDDERSGGNLEDDDIISQAPKDNRQHLRKVSFLEPEVEAQEIIYEDYAELYRSGSLKSTERSSRTGEHGYFQVSKLMMFGVALLFLEVGAAAIYLKNYEELAECCGTSIFSDSENTSSRWDKVFYWLGISFLLVLILIEIPTLIIAQEPLFLFNPMVGYLLTMQMMYATDIENAFIIYCLETAAMLGQSLILIQMQRSPEMCVHSILNYTLSGITIYMLVTLRQQEGYCIVGNRIQSIFSDNTCNTACIDEDTCFRCTSGEEGFVPQCFIRI